MAALNQVAFYVGYATEPIATASVIGGEATATLDISRWSVDSYNIKAEYGGSFGGQPSESSPVTLTISKATLTEAIGNQQFAPDRAITVRKLRSSSQTTQKPPATSCL